VSDKKMKTGDRVRIIGKHPHNGATGTVESLEPPSMVSAVPSLRGLIRIALDDNGDGCYARESELRRLRKDEDPTL
jgi:hypothetical protein